MALRPDSLVLCAGTIPTASFAERVEAAASAGFSGISLFVSDYTRARAEGLSDADMRTLLADFGLEIAELDPLMRWLPGADLGSSANEQGAEFQAHDEEEFYAVAGALCARSVNVVSVTDRPPPRAAITEAFAGLCDRASQHGLLVHLEFLPWTHIPNLAVALEIVEGAGRPNGGILLDTWHHFRSGATAADLRGARGERILALPVSDAPAKCEDDPVEETLRRRLLPGEGDIDLVEVIRALDAIGSPAPVGVEVFSDALAALPPGDAARRAAASVRAVLEKARVGEAG